MVYSIGQQDGRRRIPPPMFGAGIPVFKSSVAFQRGHGLGSILGRLVKTIIPVISKRTVKKGLSKLGKAAALAAVDAAQQSLSTPNKSFKEALKVTGKERTQGLLKEAKQAMSNQSRKTIKGGRKVKSPRYPTRGRRVVRRRDVFDQL